MYPGNNESKDFIAFKPHFYSQAFTCLMGLNRAGKAKKVESTLLCLSHIIRYAHENTNTARIADECRIIKDYLEIQKLRFAGRLTYHIHIEKCLMSRIIRKFLLVIVVERLIETVVEPKDEPYLLELVCHSKRCVIRVVSGRTEISRKK